MKTKPDQTRAELVRLRQQQRAEQRAARSSAAVQRPLPLITARQHVPFAAYAGGKPRTRRRFQASLALPGLQIHMPAFSLPAFEPGWRMLSFFLALALSTVLYLAWTAPTFQVPGVHLYGNQRLTADDINQALKISGQPIFTLEPAELETRLRRDFPELASARVSISLPNTLTVQVTERQPVILWQQNGAYTWIDTQGVAIRPRGASPSKPLITVAALATPEHGQASLDDPLAPIPYVSSDLVQAIQTLAPAVPPGTNMTYDPLYGLGWQDSRGWQAYFGVGSQDMPMKVRVYQALLDSLLPRGIYPVFISVQYPNAPYYRLSH